MEQRTDPIRVLRVTEKGVKEEALPLLMRNCLFSVLWKPEKASLLRVDRPRGENQLELEASRMRLTSQLQRLPADLAVLGSGNGLKKGKLWAADKRVLSHVEVVKDLRGNLVETLNRIKEMEEVPQEEIERIKDRKYEIRVTL